jgi:hypothetical protein
LLAGASQGIAAVLRGGGAGEGWELCDLGAAHLHGSAHLAVRTREGDVGGGVVAGDVIVVWRYGAEEGAVLEQAVGIRAEVHSASFILVVLEGGGWGGVGGCADGGLADAAREHDVLHIGYSKAEGAVRWGHGIDEQYV